jgi:hypothetical protein
MEPTLTAQDLWPLVRKLTPAEQVRLANLALRAAAGSRVTDAEAYQAVPPGPGEFTADTEPLAWESEGWEGFDAPR